MHHTFRDEGSGDPLLLLHGLVPGPDVFDPILPALTRAHRVLVPGLSGCGGSAAPGPGYTVEQSVAWLIEDLRERGVARCAVVGFSGGGYRALALALAGAIEVTDVMTLAGFADLAADHRAGLAELAGAASGGTDILALAGHTMFSERHVAAHPEAVAELSAACRTIAPSVFAAELGAMAASESLNPRLPGLRARVVVRAGDADRAMPIARAEEIASLVPGAVLEVVAGAGHSLLVEDREATLASIQRFFTR